MTHTKTTAKTLKGKHLTPEERKTIYHMKVIEGHSNRAIAKYLARALQTTNN